MCSVTKFYKQAVLEVYTHADEGALTKCAQHSLFKWVDSTCSVYGVKNASEPLNESSSLH